MQGVYSVAQVRAAEDELMARLPDGALMQRAAHALSVHCAGLLDRLYGSHVALLVGSGNNGGDALFAGARLARRGARVSALLIDPTRAHADALVAFDRAGGRVADADPALLRGADLVVDGILGIGGRGGLRGVAAELAGAAADLPTVSADVPSGVDADTGAAGEAFVRADVTVTFGALKAGTVVGDGAAACGELRLVDIGLDLPAVPTQLLEAADVRAVLPQPGAGDDKYTRGVVGVAAGSEQYAGAGVLATGAALHGGAGMVRYVGLAPDPVRVRYPEVVVHPDARPHSGGAAASGGAAGGGVRVQAWVVGPGLGTDDTAMALLSDVLRSDVPVIADADAITLIARSPGLIRGRGAPTVLTPHDREFARVAGEVGTDRLAAARRAAADLGASVLLKGNATIVAAPDGTTYVNATGTPWLGTAGSGDVLSGLIGSLLAAGLPAPLAAAAGAYVHGVAGQRAASAGPPSATDVLAELRGTIRAVTAG